MHTGKLRTAELRMAGEGDDKKISAIEGYAAVFYNADDPGTEYWIFDDLVERIHPDAFKRSLEENDMTVDFNHNPDIFLGRTAGTASVIVDRFGLKYNVPYDADDMDHRNIGAKMKREDVTGSSFVFVDRGSEWTEEEINGRTVTVRMIKDANVFSFGPVTNPAYELSLIHI